MLLACGLDWLFVVVYFGCYLLLYVWWCLCWVFGVGIRQKFGVLVGFYFDCNFPFKNLGGLVILLVGRLRGVRCFSLLSVAWVSGILDFVRLICLTVLEFLC